MTLYLASKYSSKPIKLEDLVERPLDLNCWFWLVEAEDAEIAQDIALLLFENSPKIPDVEKLKVFTGLKREKYETNNWMWPVWYR